MKALIERLRSRREVARRGRDRTRALEAERRLQVSVGRLSARDRELVASIDGAVHGNDDMWTPSPPGARRAGESYVWAGLEAMHAVEHGLEAIGRPEVRFVLDLPSGYGRVLRFLRVGYPDAEVVACDLNLEAVRFCARRLGAKPRYSAPDLDRVSFSQRFDLAWCGSLVTHLNEPDIGELLELLQRSLAPGGVAIVTTHGEQLAPNPDGVWDGGLRPTAAARIRDAVERTGFGWQPYGSAVRYGASVTSREWLRGRAVERGLREVWFEKDGWGGYQDAFAFAPA